MNCGNWLVAAGLLPDNPHDGYTLALTLEKVESHTNAALPDVYVDRGYRGHDYEGDAAGMILAAAAPDFRKLHRLAASCPDSAA